MLNTKFKLKDALAVAKEEGREEGEARGEARGEIRGMKKLLALLEKGVPLAEAKRKLRLSRNYAVR